MMLIIDIDVFLRAIFVQRMTFMVLLAVLLAFSTSAKTLVVDKDPARQLADLVAEQMREKDVAAIYAEYSPKVKRAYTRTELLSPVTEMQDVFGSITSYSFKASEYGYRLVSGEWIKTVTYWYPVRTEKYPKGRYLKVEITYEENKFYLSGYSMAYFLTEKIPAFLR